MACELVEELLLIVLRLSHCLEFYSGVSDLYHQAHHNQLSSADSCGQ